MRKLLLLACALATPLAAQLQVSLFDGGTEKPLAAVNNLGSVTMGDIADFTFHARNDSAAGMALQILGVTGQAYFLGDHPAVNTIVASHNYVTFHVLFAPTSTGSYGATLTVNGATYLMSAVSVPAPTLSISTSPTVALASGATIDFGKVQRNRSTAVTFRLANNTTSPLTVQSIAVRGDAFQGPSGITLPATLPAGVAVTFGVTFSPRVAGPLTGVLLVDNRSFNLAGTGFDAPLPQPTIVVSANAASATQPTLSLTFATVPESSGTGMLTLDFQPSTAVSGDDPTVLFPTSGSRRLSFQVNEGDSTAVFDKQKIVAFQTGTTAGTIIFTASVGAYTVRATVDHRAGGGGGGCGHRQSSRERYRGDGFRL